MLCLRMINVHVWHSRTHIERPANLYCALHCAAFTLQTACMSGYDMILPSTYAHQENARALTASLCCMVGPTANVSFPRAYRLLLQLNIIEQCISQAC